MAKDRHAPPRRNRHVTSTPCQSAAFDRIVASWAAKIAGLFAVIVGTILTIAENVRDALHKLNARCRTAGRRLLALRPGLSRPMMPKLGFLPPSASARHILARQRSPELNDAVGCVLAWMRETRQTLSPQLLMPRTSSWIWKILRQRILKGCWKRGACMSPRKEPARPCAGPASRGCFAGLVGLSSEALA